MNEKIRRTALFCALGIAIWWGYSNYPWRKNKKIPAASQSAQLSPTVSPAAVNAASRNTTDTTKGTPAAPPVDPAGLEYVESKQWGIDPFYSPRQAPPPRVRTNTIRPAQSYSLRAIIYNDTEPTAYINGKIVRTGEVVDGARVAKINRRSVLLKTSDGEQKIYVRR